MRRPESAFATPVVKEVAQRLGRAIRAARLARHLTQAQLAERANMSEVTLNRIERGVVSVGMTSWLLAMERVGLLPLLDPAADPRTDKLGEAVRASQRRVRARHSKDKDDGFNF